MFIYPMIRKHVTVYNKRKGNDWKFSLYLSAKFIGEFSSLV